MCTEDFSRYCPFIGQFFTWTSLILNIFITLLKASGSKPNVPSAFPVIGVLGGVYENLLQIAAQALFIDQTVTIALDAVDIQRLAGNATLDKNTAAIENNTAIMVMGTLCSIILFLLLVVLIFLGCANRHECCRSAYKGRTVKWYECVFGEWLCGLLVVSFVILFIMGDIDWIYNFYKDTATPGTQYRIAFLSVAFICLVVLTFYYICGLCVPGVGVALEKDKFFLPEQANTTMTVSQKMVRSQYNEWEADGPAQVEENDERIELKIEVEDHFGKTITIRVNEEITWREACMSFIKNLSKDRPKMGYDGKTNWTVKATICKGVGQAAQVTAAPSQDGSTEMTHFSNRKPLVRHTQ